MYKLASVMVSYNGSENIEKTAYALINQVDSIIIVDNGSGPETKKILCALGKASKIMIIHNNRNMGVAHALNHGISLAKASGFDWVLTMDQDSVADENMIRELFEGAEKFAGDDRTVSLSPKVVYESRLSCPDKSKVDRTKERFEEKLVVITSGNLLKVSAFERIGGFREDLFIDSVDFDFCLRLKKSGYRIMRCNQAILYHSLGERKEIRFFGTKLFFPCHAPHRKYYIVRNHIYILRNYFLCFPAFCIRKQININVIILRAIFFENNKFENVKYIWRGFLDGIMNKYGDLELSN
jgi:rhamnosyltransferase